MRCARVQERRLQPKDVYFLDVGANLGVHTLTAAAYGFSVIAFEPLWPNVQALRRSLCANPALARRVTLLTQVRPARCYQHCCAGGVLCSCVAACSRR